LYLQDQRRIQKISEGVTITIKKRFSRVFEASELLFFRFYREKIEKNFYEGVAVAGSPTAGSATVQDIGFDQIYGVKLPIEKSIFF
jgi:hypothetical protein